MYSSFARKLFESADSQSAVSEIKLFIQKLRDRLPILAEFEIGFRAVIFTGNTTKQKNLVRYILRKFAEHDQFKFTVDWDELSIEHVQPQSTIGTGLWTEELVGQLGNLFLLDAKKNEEIGDKPFPEKKSLLASGGYSVPAIIAQVDEWTPETVTAHTTSMAAIAHAEIWKI